jgi:hypothetical protein
MRNDAKIKHVRTLYGLEGYAIYNMLLEIIGEADDLKIPWNDITIKLLYAPDINILPDILVKMAETMVSAPINLLQLEDGFLMCKQLVRRHQRVFEKRKGNKVSENDDNPSRKDSKSAGNDNFWTQSKVNKRKEKERKYNPPPIDSASLETKYPSEFEKLCNTYPGNTLKLESFRLWSEYPEPLQQLIYERVKAYKTIPLPEGISYPSLFKFLSGRRWEDVQVVKKCDALKKTLIEKENIPQPPSFIEEIAPLPEEIPIFEEDNQEDPVEAEESLRIYREGVDKLLKKIGGNSNAINNGD